MIDVIRAGLLTSVQDAGRYGYQHLGVTTGGALDQLALEVGNRLVGNQPHAAVLEITVGPVELRFNCASRIAITGAEYNATLDNEPVHAWWSVPVCAGQTLVLHEVIYGARAYLCIRGGIDVTPMLGSCSTDLDAHFGGFDGRALRDGDQLAIGTLTTRFATRTHTYRGAQRGKKDARKFGVKAPVWCRFANKALRLTQASDTTTEANPATQVRVLPGPEYDSFTEIAQQTLWSQPWRVTPNSNRMGYRLAGASILTRNESNDLLSHAVLPGTIQVPPNGQPIVLMGDAQTTGGYPRIGVVIRADLWRLAQVGLNDWVRFIRTTREEALFALKEQGAYLQQIDVALAMSDG